MAGITPKTNRHTRRAAAVTAPIEPAIAASADRAAIERDPAIIDPGIITPVMDGPIDGTVLPEPTLVAEADAPKPIVTASPILAAEPGAMDVVRADAAADRVQAGLETASGLDEAHLAAAGQPTLTIEGSGADRAARVIADRALGDDVFPLDGASDLMRELTEFRERNPDGFASLRAKLDDPGTPTLDEILRGLELMALTDPIAMDIIGTRFFADRFAHRDNALGVDPAGAADTVSVIEVVGPLQGRRRVGMSFGPQPTRFLASSLSEDSIATLRADPLLAVGVSEVAAADIDLALLA